jgi:hypothetical protein
MAKKQSGKGKRRVPKTVLRLPDLDQAKSAVLTASVRSMLNEGTGMRSRNSLNGNARSRGSRSARPSSSGIVSTSNLGIWPQARLISASVQCAASPTRRQTVGS